MKFGILYFVLIFSFNISFSGQTISDFKLKDANNDWKSFLEVKGENLTVLDFWATWCSPCIKAIPKLNSLDEIYTEKGVRFIGINVDSPRNEAKIRPFINAHKIKYTVLKDPNGEITSRLNISNIPVLLIINSNNEIVYRHQGYRSGDEKIIESEIIKQLAGEDK